MQTIRYIFSDGTTSEIEVTDELYISIYENVLQYLFRLVQTLSLLARHQKRTAKKLAVLFWYNKESRRRQKGRKGFLLRRGRDPCRCLLYGSAESEYFTNRLKILQYFTRIGRGQDKNWTTSPYTESVNFHGRYV